MCVEAPPKVLTAFRFGVAMRAWVQHEAKRLHVTSSDVVRVAVQLLQAQSPNVREAIVRDAERDGGTPLERV